MADPSDFKPSLAVYLNGCILPAPEASLPAGSQGVLSGVGFYETFRTSGGRPHLWPFHRQRLEDACGRAGMLLPADFLVRDDARLAAVVAGLLARAGRSDAVFRYTLLAGPPDGGPDAGRPSELLTLRTIPAAAPETGICLRILTQSRDSGEWIPRPKSVNQLNALLGARELERRTNEPSDEGLFLSREGGLVVETTRQNVAWIRDGCLCYPDASLGPVAGTGLVWVLSLGVPARPCRAQPDDLLAADAVVVVNSVRGVSPVREIRDAQDRVLVTDLGSPGDPLVVSLRRQWAEALEATAEAVTR